MSSQDASSNRTAPMTLTPEEIAKIRQVHIQQQEADDFYATPYPLEFSDFPEDEIVSAFDEAKKQAEVCVAQQPEPLLESSFASTAPLNSENPVATTFDYQLPIDNHPNDYIFTPMFTSTEHLSYNTNIHDVNESSDRKRESAEGHPTYTSRVNAPAATYDDLSMSSPMPVNSTPSVFPGCAFVPSFSTQARNAASMSKVKATSAAFNEDNPHVYNSINDLSTLLKQEAYDLDIRQDAITAREIGVTAREKAVAEREARVAGAEKTQPPSSKELLYPQKKAPSSKTRTGSLPPRGRTSRQLIVDGVDEENLSEDESSHAGQDRRQMQHDIGHYYTPDYQPQLKNEDESEDESMPDLIHSDSEHEGMLTPHEDDELDEDRDAPGEDEDIENQEVPGRFSLLAFLFRRFGI